MFYPTRVDMRDLFRTSIITLLLWCSTLLVLGDSVATASPAVATTLVPSPQHVDNPVVPSTANGHSSSPRGWLTGFAIFVGLGGFGGLVSYTRLMRRYDPDENEN